MRFGRSENTDGNDHDSRQCHRLRCRVCVLTTGCTVPDPYPPTPSTDAAQSLEQLESLPALEDSKAQLLAAMDEITSAATQRIAGTEWRTQANADSGNCPAPYEKSDGVSEYLPNRYASNISLSEKDWSGLLQVAKGAAGKVGATDMQVMQDGPNNHDVRFSGPAGIYINFGYQGNLGVSGYTGCRLPQDKRAPTK